MVPQLNHELHETHESDGVVWMVVWPDEAPKEQGLLSEVRQQRDGKSASLQVMEDLGFLHAADAGLCLEFQQNLAVTNEIRPVDRLEDTTKEADWDCRLALECDAAVS